MKFFKKTLMVIAMLLLSVATFAVPANPKPVTVVQPNGKHLTFILQGDERVNWAKTLDGYSLLSNKDGNKVYAMLDANGNMVASNVLACNPEERSAEEIAFLSTIQPNLFFSTEQIRIKREGFAKISGMNQEGPTAKYPTTGVDSLLVILVSFSDLDFTFTNQDFVNLTAQSNYNNTGSVKDYFLEQSDSTFEMAIRVVGPYTLPNNMAYYGGHATYYGQEIHDKNMTYFVRDAINAADPDVDFSHFDNDGDGKVDGMHIIFAGTPESSTGHDDEIWPHRGDVNSSIQKDGVRFTVYSCSAEKRTNTQMDNIGTICHEFGHVLGLPDDYDTDYEGNNGSAITTGTWDVMCEGSYNNNGATPPYWSTWQKSLTNWISLIDTLDVSTARDSIRVPCVSGKKDTCFYVHISGNEFFLIEARRKVNWDRYIPGNGLIIYHGNQGRINSWINNQNNNINVNPNDRGWFIEPSDGILSHTNTAYAPFPGTSQIAYFTADSPNAMTLANGTTSVSGISFTDIHYVDDSTLMFNFNSTLPMVTTNNASNIGLYSFDASGDIMYAGSGTIQSKGVVYSTAEDFTFDSGTQVFDNDLTNTSSISVSIDNLERGETYYYRSFVISSTGMGMGIVKSMQTRTGFGTVTTMGAQNIDSTSARLRGTMTYTGMAPFIAKGFVYTTDSEELPSIENATVISLTDSTTGQFTYDLTGLTQGTTYYVRAFVTNEYGTGYGMRNSFQTLYPAITNNQIASNQQVCQGVTPQQITGQTPQGGFGNFTYKWEQKKTNSAWEDAEGVNDQINYQPQILQDSTQFRRIVYSDGRVNSTSNTVLIDVRISRGGNIQFALDTVEQNSQHQMKLINHRGDLVAWEVSSNNGEDYTAINTLENPYNATFDALGEFIYRAKVQIDACPEAYSTTKTVNVISTESINDVANAIDFSIMPNPSSNGTFAINADIDNATIIISNVLGQKVYEENNADLRNKTISLSVEDGSYFVTIMENNKKATQQLIIKK